MKIQNLQTPALIVDADVMAKNREAMKGILAASGVKLRPHYKSHKCARLAMMQLEDGAVGMTCAKLSEAMDLADAGIGDILIANQILQPEKIWQAALLAKVCRLTLCVDHAENVKMLSHAATAVGSELHCLVEYEIGMGRCGVSTEAEVCALARQIKEAPGLSFDGVQAYAGHLSHTVSYEERKEESEKNAQKLRSLLAALAEAGTPVNVLSGGSTGTCQIKAAEGLYTELQAGSYLVMDATYKELSLPFRNSLFIVATVVSAREDLVVIDAGVKSCGVDQGMPEPIGFRYEKIVASEEHFQIWKPSRSFSVGERMFLVPAHCCSTVNLYDKLYLCSRERILERIPVSARGCSK